MSQQQSQEDFNKFAEDFEEVDDEYKDLDLTSVNSQNPLSKPFRL